jgi:CRISPR/Cas system-associated exonuclease Cas4 (RecB family)
MVAVVDVRDQMVNRDRKVVEMDDRREIQENRHVYHRHQIQTQWQVLISAGQHVHVIVHDSLDDEWHKTFSTKINLTNNASSIKQTVTTSSNSNNNRDQTNIKQ